MKWKCQLGAFAIRGVAEGSHLPISLTFEHAERPDDILLHGMPFPPENTRFTLWPVKYTQVLPLQSRSVESFWLILRLYSCMNEYEIRQWCRNYEASDNNKAEFFILRPRGRYGVQIILSGMQTLSAAAHTRVACGYGSLQLTAVTTSVWSEL